MFVKSNTVQKHVIHPARCLFKCNRRITIVAVAECTELFYISVTLCAEDEDFSLLLNALDSKIF